MGNVASSELLLAENDRTFNALWVLGVEQGSFACECGGTDCSERMDLSLIEYAAREGGQVLLARGHATAGAVPPLSVNS
jgi:hypothetical protein